MKAENRNKVSKNKWGNQETNTKIADLNSMKMAKHSF